MLLLKATTWMRRNIKVGISLHCSFGSLLSSFHFFFLFPLGSSLHHILRVMYIDTPTYDSTCILRCRFCKNIRRSVLAVRHDANSCISHQSDVSNYPIDE